MFNNMVGNIAAIAAGIGAIIFVCFIIKDIAEISKGQGSVLKTVGKVICVFALIGVIYASVNYSSFGQAFSQVATEAVEGVAEEAGTLFE